MYKKGIEVLKFDLKRYQEQGKNEEAIVATRQLGSALAKIADLFMTDLCDEQDAEQNCEIVLKEAL